MSAAQVGLIIGIVVWVISAFKLSQSINSRRYDLAVVYFIFAVICVALCKEAIDRL